MRTRIFEWLATITVRRAGTVFFIFTLLTLISMGLSSKIRMEMTWNAMVPKDHPSSKTFQEVIDSFGAATQIIIALEGGNSEQLIRAAETLKPALENSSYRILSDEGMDMQSERPAVKRVVTKYDTGFMAGHGLMLYKKRDLERTRTLFTDYNIVPYLGHVNDMLEREYVRNSDNLVKQEKDAVRGLDGMYEFVESIGRSVRDGKISDKDVKKAVDTMTIGRGYLLSTDRRMLIVSVTPYLSLNAPFDETVAAVNAIEGSMEEVLKGYPGVEGSMTGGHVITRDEMEAGMEDTVRNVAIAFVIILLIFILSFRMITGPLLAMLVLVSGISWDMGITSLVIGRLNIFTAMCGVVLLGLGVDFAIHILSAYTEFRHKGFVTEKAMKETFLRIGSGLVTGAFTTSFAFLALVFTSYPAFKEFGFVVGFGILACLAASLVYLPSSIVLIERIRNKLGREKAIKQVDMEFKFIGSITNITTRYPLLTIMATLLVSLILLYFIKDVSMNSNYMDMEPEGLQSIRLQREIPKRFNMSADNIFCRLDNLDEVNRLTDLLNERPAIGLVESISDYLPSNEKQDERRRLVREIALDQNNLPGAGPVDMDVFIEELMRFGDNLMEMSSLAYISGLDRVFDKTNYFLGLNDEGDIIGTNRVEEIISIIGNHADSPDLLNDYQAVFRPLMEERVRAMANPEPITMEMLPEDIRERFISRDGKQYLMIVYADRDIWDGLITSSFVETVTRDIPHASGMPLLMKAMVQTASEEGTRAFLYAFIALFVLLIIDFRSIKTTIVAVLPMLLAFLWMLGIMGWTGFPFSIVNIMGLPLILGIGIDDGVHVIHRYRIEGREKMSYSMSSIGKAIFLTTMTTVFGFGSLIPSTYRGYGSLGSLVVLGIVLCFVTSVIVLPSILKMIYGPNKSDPRFFKKRGFIEK